MNVLDEFKNYKREFIQISPRTAILLHIFSKDSDDFEDIFLLDNEGYREESYCTKIYKDAADQFFKQFEGNECLYTVSFFYSYYDKNLFKRYHDLKQDLIRHYDLLQEYKTTYDNFILGLENESNSNQ